MEGWLRLIKDLEFGELIVLGITGLLIFSIIAFGCYVAVVMP